MTAHSYKPSHQGKLSLCLSNLFFHLTVRDVSAIRGRGTVVTGQVESSVLKVGDNIQITRPGATKTSMVIGIESFGKQMNQARMGDNIGVLLRDISKQDVQHGDIMVAADSKFTWRP
ncbi:EF-Tu/IF-2/RF-3 family GTPase [Roseiflexus castenholzii]|uniref:EF-Tu/IF-2/RF-3 family GTPase n=1 Tax=Roseiflexus castenholzii TaxID=120962 RepID=UPI0000E76173